jgi:hypothetical protein
MDLLMKAILGEKITDKDLQNEIGEIRDNDLVLTLARKETPTDAQLAAELYEICDSVHSSCDSSCPVYRLNGNQVPDTANDFKVNRGCDCFKNGTAMLKFIRKKSK